MDPRRYREILQCKQDEKAAEAAEPRLEPLCVPDSSTGFALDLLKESSGRRLTGGELLCLFQEAALEDLVRLPGNLTHLDQVMQAADLFCMSSLWEGLPLVLLEAMAAGLPAMAYAIPGVTEVLENGVTGGLAETGDPQELASVLEGRLGNAGLRRSGSVATRARVAADFDFEHLVYQMEILYAQFAARRD